MHPETLAAVFVTLALSLPGASSVAWANQPTLPPGTAPLPTGDPTALPTTEAPGAVGPGAETFIPPAADAATYQDVHSDSVWVTPTALTPPQGSFSVQSQEIFILSASYSVTDRVQVTGMLLPFPGEDLVIAAAGLKVQLARAERLRFALQGAIFSWSEEEGFDESVVNGGAIATLCLDRACHSLLNGYAGFLVNTGETARPVTVASAGAVIGLTRNWKLLAELNLLTEDDAFPNDPFALLLYGMRVTGSRVGFDFGFARPAEADAGDDIGPGIPWFKLTWRMR